MYLQQASLEQSGSVLSFRRGFPLIVVLALALIPAASARAACPGFASAASYAAGTHPISVAVGDFNGDGKADIAAANHGSNSVSLFRGNGNGTFQAPLNASTGSNPKSLAAADFNRDGKLDLVVANETSNNVSVLLGNGNGTFAAAVNFAVGLAPVSVAVADFNRDGKQDVAVVNRDLGSVSILLGNGAGSLSVSSVPVVGATPLSVAIGDVNRDGKPDLVVANLDSANVSVRLGNGDGTFGSVTNFAAGSGPYSVAIADFNRDSKPDLAVANDFTDKVSILAGDGAGAFGAPSEFDTGTGPLAVAVADFDADGDVDLATANVTTQTISILTGNGAGSFNAAGSPSALSPYALAVGDFDSDGKPDLAVPNYSGNKISVLLNNSICPPNCGTLKTPVNYTAGTGTMDVATGDFNRDGIADLAAANLSGSTISILIGNAFGGFGAPSNIALAAQPQRIRVGDFNRDGLADLVASSANQGLVVLLASGQGTFAAPVAYPVINTTVYDLATGDLNRDGHLDLVLATGWQITVLLGSSTGVFGSPVHFIDGSVASPVALALADFNRDGLLDVVYTGTDKAAVRLGNGDGTIGSSLAAVVAGSAPRSIAVGDFNSDGKVDIATASFNADDDISVLLGNGDGTFQPKTDYLGTNSNASILAADISGDGHEDLVVAHGSDYTLSVLIGDGDGTFENPVFYPALGIRPQAGVVVDVNRDGRLDVAMANFSDGVAVYLNGCPPAPNLRTFTAESSTFTQGDVGKAYRVLVRNDGNLATSGTVTATAALSAGLIPTDMFGTGWTCDVATLSCTRSDVLPVTASYPLIEVIVTVRSNAPATVSNVSDVSGGGEINVSDNTYTATTPVATSGLVAPTSFVATAVNATQVNLSWDPVSTATGYRIFRSTAIGTYPEIATAPSASWADTTATANTAYLYLVKATDGASDSGYSNFDLANTTMFTNDPLVPMATIATAAHILQLRTAVSSLRSLAVLAPATFTGTPAPGAAIEAVHVTELRTALSEAYAALGRSMTFSNPALAVGSTLRAADIQELRQSVK